MNLAEKLQLLRNNNRLSQEELAEKLGISRQAISKWESGQSTPDLKKLIVIAELYNVTIDSLVKDSDEFHILQSNGTNNREEQKVDDKKTQLVININRGYSMEYEYKSKKTLFGLSLVHINIGRGFKKAKGIISIGNISYGMISLGFISFGILSCGLMSIGLITLAILSIGLLLAVGVMSAGIFSIGAISIGIFSLGAVSIGKYAFGAVAIASDIAIGDYAKANIAIGNKVKGINTLSLDTSVVDIKNLIKQEYPNLSKWIMDIINFFIKYITIRTR
ncbi:helix-turn-helix domain-containing protein [Clostridium sporogenes]|uniref:XRE family transcriptional regulator n=1 Tax=Clostridium botulinum TaxID=1491 RepID=A0A6M0SY54_CLOBO|nr:helix-turn-helix transcriptional regulator [Clostridium sporogenes]NFA59875.1 XRE family transcriptional regulator [Clostridium botulinum]NFI74052.1 helix-turn-helix transcriptional regulator [Clostridium sporogenes]NFL71766.1 helix-turn-helix transcriptional regulator [Clostridium sporogenes]NFM24622.1 helix-turn-helix transcriptional regulator [Clostridium sporogenes]NFP61926.1 helix-turn-helix transcriptional regulator [Clostridium sporogenes]